ncbi:hypothetical protein PPUJ20066_26070 [Pseudomonas putida]|nr:hypothetical protein PPUJ20066_26070 [Pseudomonas putida]
MTGASLTVSQVQSIPWSAAPSSTWLLLVTPAFVTTIVMRGIDAKRCAIRAVAVFEVPVSFQDKEVDTVGAIYDKADRLLQESGVGDDRDYAQSSNVSHCIRRDVGSLWISVMEGYRAGFIPPVASPVGEPTNGVSERGTDVNRSG